MHDQQKVTTEKKVFNIYLTEIEFVSFMQCCSKREFLTPVQIFSQ